MQFKYILAHLVLFVLLSACSGGGAGDTAQIGDDGVFSITLVHPDTREPVAGAVVAIHAPDGISIEAEAITDDSGRLDYETQRTRATITIGFDEPSTGRSDWRYETYIDVPLRDTVYPLGFAPPFPDDVRNGAYGLTVFTPRSNGQPVVFRPGNFIGEPNDTTTFGIGVFQNNPGSAQESVLVMHADNNAVSYAFDLDYIPQADSNRVMELTETAIDLAWSEQNSRAVSDLAVFGARNSQDFELSYSAGITGNEANTSGTIPFFNALPDSFELSYFAASLTDNENSSGILVQSLRRSTPLSNWQITLPTRETTDISINSNDVATLFVSGSDARLQANLLLLGDGNHRWRVMFPATQTRIALPDLPSLTPDFNNRGSIGQTSTVIALSIGQNGESGYESLARTFQTGRETPPGNEFVTVQRSRFPDDPSLTIAPNGVAKHRGWR